MAVLMVDSVPAIAALRLYLYCSQGADDPTMTLWSTIVCTQLHIFAAQACAIIFLIVKRMSSMVSRFGLGIRTVSSGLTETERSRGDTSAATSARRQRRVSAGALSFEDEDEDEISSGMWRDDESRRAIMAIIKTTDYRVAHHETDGRDDANRIVL